MTEPTEWEDLPFDLAEEGRLKVREHGGSVWLVTDKEAFAVAPEHATQIGFDLVEATGKVR